MRREAEGLEGNAAIVCVCRGCALIADTIVREETQLRLLRFEIVGSLVGYVNTPLPAVKVSLGMSRYQTS